MLVTDAYISGPLGMALFNAGGRAMVLEAGKPQEPRASDRNEIGFFFNAGLEIKPASRHPSESVALNDVQRLLDDEWRKHKALNGVLVGMDPDHPPELRRSFIRRAERLMSDASVRSFVEARVLIPYSAELWDPGAAGDLASEIGAKIVARLYELLSGDAVSHAVDCISVAVRELFTSSIEREGIRASVYRSGIVGAVAACLFNNDAVQLKGLIFQQNRFVGLASLDPNRRLLARIIKIAEERMPAPIPEDWQVEHETDLQETVDPIMLMIQDAVEIRKQSRILANPNQLGAVEREIEWIIRHLQRGNELNAESALRKLIERQLKVSQHVHIVKSLTRIASTASELRRFEFANRVIGYAQAFDQLDATLESAAAEILRRQSRLIEALAAYDKAVEDFPNDVFARNGRAETLRDLGRLQEALAAYDKAVEDFPDNVVARNGRAETLRDLGRLQEALAAYDKAVEDFPNDMFARCGRAYLLCLLGRSTEAIGLLREAAATPRTRADWVAVHIIAMALLREGRNEDALHRIDQGIQGCPFKLQRRYFLRARAVALVAAQRAREAERDLSKLISNEPAPQTRKTLILIQAHALALDGRKEDSERAITEANEVVPYSVFLQKRLEQELTSRYGLFAAASPATEAERRAADTAILDLETTLVVGGYSAAMRATKLAA